MSDGYKVEISALRRTVAPLEESMVAAKDVRAKKSDIASHATHAGSEVVTSAVDGFLESWDYGMGELIKYSEDIVDKLNETISGYEQAEELGIENFTPTAENLASLPSGPVGQWQYDQTHPDLPGNKPGWEKSADGWQQSFEDWAFG
ncbi:hypothetical protein ACTWJ8_33035 [Streptomyces sp. SDT5-1]|uniref:hypothetical protein n=1 Tax=Streptomyces sp. SDT5-1 TaxID=3406418 RepID=UPI003FD0067C